ncbi:hypothetical protein CY0110_17737 [Crocosphaera chwakensis CCY0110]|uniref:Uncharacterized protein n=1 Tax=Crocosphaera chwakensis CCY0110 TaxID=391612 RepID=A3IIM9_9CHRO|nr:hypothetical protein CY0110_17737 [Crocosphaera chwakensis CCY0110]
MSIPGDALSKNVTSRLEWSVFNLRRRRATS